MTKRIQITLPSKVLKAIETLVAEGMYLNLNDFFREASRMHLRHITNEPINIVESD